MPCGRVGKFCHATWSFFSFPIFFLGAFAVFMTRVMPSRKDWVAQRLAAFPMMGLPAYDARI